jgi:uncharacterized membrane protein (DUF485 family)
LFTLYGKKIMAQQKFCPECSQRHECRDVYQQLGKAEGPSVVFKVVVAFLLPLMVFIVVLAASEKILAKTINSKESQTAISFLLALFVTSVCILIIKVIYRQLSKDK